MRSLNTLLFCSTYVTLRHHVDVKTSSALIIITNSQTSRAARPLNSVVTSRGVPAYCILLSIPRDHGTSTRVFRWRLCHEGLCRASASCYFALVNLTKECKICLVKYQIPNGLVFLYGIILCNLKSFCELRVIRRNFFF